MYKHILLPTDGSDRSLRAIDSAIELARTMNAEVTGLFVSERAYIPDVDEGPKPLAAEALAVIAERAKEAGVKYSGISTLGDSPADVIVNYAQDQGCDLIVMGTRGRSKIGKFLLGSTAASVIADCVIPVLLYR
jgi:nucleotide-binding universal stress UspA family protein